MNYTVTHIKYNELPHLYDMLWRSYEYHFKHSPRDFFKPFVEQNPNFKPENFLIIKDGEKIISSVQVFIREVYFDKSKMILGGIGQVATLPDYRGQGLSKILLKESINYMQKLNVDYSLLFAGPVKLYEKFGWQELKIKSCFTNIGKIPKLKLKNLKIKKFSEKFRYDLFYIHNEYIKNFNNCIIRNPVYWDTYFSKFKAAGTKIYFLEKDKKAVAYIVTKKDGKTLTIYEYSSLEPQDIQIAGALILYAIKKEKPESIYIPYVNEYYSPFLFVKQNFNCETNICSGFMVRNVKNSINWSKSIDRVLFFLSDAF